MLSASQLADAAYDRGGYGLSRGPVDTFEEGFRAAMQRAFRLGYIARMVEVERAVEREATDLEFYAGVEL